MSPDQAALDRITELEALLKEKDRQIMERDDLLEDAFVVIDCQQDEMNGQDDLIKILRAQVASLQNGQKVDYSA